MFINRYLIQFIKGKEKAVMAIIAMQLMLTLSASAIFLFTNQLINILIKNEEIDWSKMATSIIAILLLLIFIFLLSKRKAHFSETTALQIKDNLRTQLMQKIMLLGPALITTERTGNLASTITSKVEWMKHYYTLYLPTVTAALINLIIFLTLIFRVDRITGWVALLAAAGMLICPMLFYRLMEKRGKQEWEEHARYYSDCLDGIQGVSSLKALNANQRHVEKIHRQGEKFRAATMSHLAVTITESAVLELFARIGSALTLAVVTVRYLNGQVTQDSLFPCFFYISACFVPMLAIINAWHMGFQGVAGAYAINELLKKSLQFSLNSKDIPAALCSRNQLQAILQAETNQQLQQPVKDKIPCPNPV